MGSFQDARATSPSRTTSSLAQTFILDAYSTSIRVSLVTAVRGGVFGFLLAYAVILGGLPRFVRNALMTFSGVASNFAGVPLALAFIFTLGHVGFLTLLSRPSSASTSTTTASTCTANRGWTSPTCTSSSR